MDNRGESSVCVFSLASMDSTSFTINQAEAFVQQLAETLTHPRERECLCCFVARQLDEYHCDGSHRHAIRYRDAVAPRATALRDRLRRVGACCCDCELFLNGYQLRPPVRSDSTGGTGDDDEDAEVWDDLPPCTGVPKGSIRPCRNWLRCR